ncbi:iron complex outermembrane receptor protein [Sphingobium sp. B1D7B]|uniref:TonB-dependent receptor plug domain-containing protein n=1 Tax=unclassified Sphingobium TaxID=2611147 RepID=UPI00222457A2|nr:MULTISPECIES: TonB-dependent receptor [unclassified Sphingobium]MCW2393011.1 iron complex outermembrane receptor protein [Sphingobium sp. B11D3A]MCW2404814.1 iron complex outermembrane receptor protein [Sphingobium sp. B1D7B]MCW2413155.1 iron complex outermembrane receptor protein [Sphingobium sp. B8D3D]MCW2414547.1 iron complex outermembrane receptor protein [Sphingobium sp. B8D3A]
MITRRNIAALLLLTSAAIPAAAVAQTAETPQEPPADGGEIIVTGTRSTGMMAAESAAPIQLLSSSALEKVGQPNLNQALTQLVPSFQAQTQGTDMASFSLSARLRGLSPNHTLVLVNGKRRHGNSILQVINGAFGGSAAPSIDLIPPDIVQRIEVLQDGAAAQYGSDAIAGVINIILKSDTYGGAVKFNAGQYYDGEGTTYSASGNFGMPIGESGFLDLSLFHRRNDWTTVGDGQFSVRNYDGTTVTNVSAAFKPLLDACNAENCTAGINGGQPASQLTLGFYNFGYDFGGVELYSFGNISYRHGDALQGYRHPTRLCRTTAGTATTTDPTNCFGTSAQTGLVPHIEVKQDEFQFTTGLRGEISGWDWDLAGSYSEDVAKVYTTNSANASLFVATGQSPSDFYDGSFKFTQFVGTLDLRKEFDVGFEDPLNFAIGAEYRKETYAIGAGDALSRYVEGGQSFPGYALSDAGTLSRNAKAAYIDVAVNPVPDWTVDVAGRYEHYSDFGDTTIGKITTRYDFSPAFAIRGTASTGFRAPSLQESGYSATNVGPTSATLQLAPSSPGSASAGFGALSPEKSVNFSAGIVLRPISRLTITLDGYLIKIKDRIVSSGSITGQQFVNLTSPPQRVGIDTPAALINGLTPYDLVINAINASGKQLDPTVRTNGSLAIQTFTNGIDTRTMGLELAARYPVDLPFGNIDFSIGGNYNLTKVTKNKLGTLFGPTSEQIIEKASPAFKGNFSALFTSGKFTANARVNYYSKTNQFVQPNSTSANGNASRGIAALPAPILLSNNQRYYNAEVAPAAIVDLEFSYEITKFANLAIGANNLFDKMPEVPALVGNYDPATWPTTGVSPYINNGGTFNAPYTFGPYGSNGGYYYARLTLKF